MSNEMPSIFTHGSNWVRADFHLHTHRDGQFHYDGPDNQFISAYVAGLAQADIRVGVITNHNKFDYDEFRALLGQAREHEIHLIPGVELTMNDGANGIHALVVFSSSWLENGKDYINDFLTVAFAGKARPHSDNTNERSSLSLTETYKTLESYNRDYFVVFAHVEAKGGLWNELAGGRIQDLGCDKLFCRRTLGFQKVRTHDSDGRKCRQQVKTWLNNWYPAEVEGSDPKSIQDIGSGRQCFLKLGDFSFEAVLYALKDFANRVATAPKTHERSYIISVSFEGGGGTLDGKSINLSPELNTLIGIRGSGKSSILEAIRYALDIPFGEKTADVDYKNSLVGHTLGSGGKVTILAKDRHGRPYEVRRIYKEQPDVYVDRILRPGISIRETVIHKPIYFGQKDLSATGEGFEKDLVEKLVGDKLTAIRHQIEAQRLQVSNASRLLMDLSGSEDERRECVARKQDAEFKLNLYKEHGVEEKLQKQLDFDTDSRKCARVIADIKQYLSDLESFINEHDDDLRNQRVYTSQQNQAFFGEFFKTLDRLVAEFDKIKAGMAESVRLFKVIQDKAAEFERIREGLKEEFAEAERILSEQLKQAGAGAIRPDEFKELRIIVDTADQMLEALEKQASQKTFDEFDLVKQLTELNDCWHAEYRHITGELEKINRTHSALQIKAEYKGDKEAFLSYMKNMFRGSGIREAALSNLVHKYQDFGAIYQDFNNVRTILGGAATPFEQYFNNNLANLLTWQVPNHFMIEYRGKELKHHSLGQRASALILFVLSQRDNDLFIIDQPEDDLDNQTIYEDVIKLIRQMKPMAQFIFATHNANFPVLGDAEQIFSCVYADDTISIKSGSIDRPDMQKEIIDIMEGGEEAFNHRKSIYELWKPRNS